MIRVNRMRLRRLAVFEGIDLFVVAILAIVAHLAVRTVAATATTILEVIAGFGLAALLLVCVGELVDHEA